MHVEKVMSCCFNQKNKIVRQKHKNWQQFVVCVQKFSQYDVAYLIVLGFKILTFESYNIDLDLEQPNH